MHILALTRAERKHKKSRDMADIPQGITVDTLTLSKEQQLNLKQTLKQIDLTKYDRIVLSLKFHYIKNQGAYLSTLKGLCIIDEDSWFNFQANKHFTEFEYFYHQIPDARFLLTGWYVRDKFIEQGLDAVYVSKSYDEQALRNLKTVRDISYGFVGTTIGPIYKKRRQYLKGFRQQLSIHIGQTQSMEEYLQLLNRIQYFISADIGFNEYMIKNFEAMACGCVLVAYRTGGEEEHLGLKDMENVVLYSTVEEAVQKIRKIEATAGLAEKIAQAGQALVQTRFTDYKRNQQLYAEIIKPLHTSTQDKRPLLRKVVANILNYPPFRKILRVGTLTKHCAKKMIGKG